MTIQLDHTIVPAHDKEASARFFARIFGLSYHGPMSHFAPVRINDTLTIDFDNWEQFEHHHYAFKVSEAEFDGIFDRVKAERIAVWQWTALLGGHDDQPSSRRARLLFQGPERAPARSADSIGRRAKRSRPLRPGSSASRVALAQFEALDLAGGGLWQIVEKADQARAFEGGSGPCMILKGPRE